jgi:hypothetical protein
VPTPAKIAVRYIRCSIVPIASLIGAATTSFVELSGGLHGHDFERMQLAFFVANRHVFSW